VLTELECEKVFYPFEKKPRGPQSYDLHPDQYIYTHVYNTHIHIDVYIHFCVCKYTYIFMYTYISYMIYIIHICTYIYIHFYIPTTHILLRGVVAFCPRWNVKHCNVKHCNVYRRDLNLTESLLKKGGVLNSTNYLQRWQISHPSRITYVHIFISIYIRKQESQKESRKAGKQARNKEKRKGKARKKESHLLHPISPPPCQ